MQPRQVLTTNAPKPMAAYSQAIVANGFVFVSGQAGLDERTGQLVSPEILRQVETAFRNLEAVLVAAGATLQDVVKVTAHLSDLNDFGVYDETYRHYFKEPYPARTTVQSGLGQLRIELDAIAVIRDR